MQNHYIQKSQRAVFQAGVLLGSLCLAAAGCAGSHENERSTTSAHARSHAGRHTDADGVTRDRDGRVVRDADGRPVRDDETVRTADVGRDQSVKPVAIATVPDNASDPNSTASDRQLTARIREAISADDRLSANAKNVQITSSKDEVTLRGSVANAEEKTRVESHAKQEAGSRRVNNQLEVTR